MNTELDKSLLDEIVKHLLNAYKPLAIYLFGSQVWGKPDTSSDMDFFIVVDKSEYDAAERIRIGLRELKGIHANVDLLVYTSSEIAEKKDHPSTLVYKVLNKGVKIYEAA
ncbi:MAG TPA: nucleotidyltransferase domain-containing protein [Spirochaetota bacterium]|nr:nucleotidyltransferase domain-containing protein [Spirochaetota bacterium]HQP49808.1 nucleotidyltransferase domain-containing protein [Spirochaetota bacterium]